MKCRVKPFNEISRWQRNRCLRQDIDEAIFKNYNFEEETNTNIAIPSKEQTIEKCQVENSVIHSQSPDLNDILQYSSDSNDSNEDVQEQIDLIEDTLDNDNKTTNTINFVDLNETFSSELRFWAITNNISHDALSKLLKLYKKYHPNEKIPSERF